MITRYVNTASTAGGDGTTNATAGANRAYASLQEAIGALPGTLSDAYTFYCEGSAADTLQVSISQWDFVTSAANYVLVTTTPANRHDGKWNTSKYRIEVTDADAIYNGLPSHVRLDGLQAQVTVSTSLGHDYVCFRLCTGANLSTVDHRISHCIGRVVVSGGATDPVYIFSTSEPVTAASTGTVQIWNCVAYGGFMGFYTDPSVWSAANVRTYNCTAYGNQFNFGGAQICVNCLGASPTVGNSFESVGSTGHSNNASTDATANGTNARDNQTFSFVNAAAGDFHLLVSDAGAKGFGLTDPASGLFSDDIDGQTRTGAWDIGADQYVAVSAVGYFRTRFVT